MGFRTEKDGNGKVGEKFKIVCKFDPNKTRFYDIPGFNLGDGWIINLAAEAVRDCCLDRVSKKQPFFPGSVSVEMAVVESSNPGQFEVRRQIVFTGENCDKNVGMGGMIAGFLDEVASRFCSILFQPSANVSCGGEKWIVLLEGFPDLSVLAG